MHNPHTHNQVTTVPLPILLYTRAMLMPPWRNQLLSQMWEVHVTECAWSRKEFLPTRINMPARACRRSAVAFRRYRSKADTNVSVSLSGAQIGKKLKRLKQKRRAAHGCQPRKRLVLPANDWSASTSAVSVNSPAVILRTKRTYRPIYNCFSSLTKRESRANARQRLYYENGQSRQHIIVEALPCVHLRNQPVYLRNSDILQDDRAERVVQFSRLADTGRGDSVHHFRHGIRVNGAVRVAARGGADAEGVGTGG